MPIGYRLTPKRLDRLSASERSRLNLLTMRGGVDSSGVRWISAMRAEVLNRKKDLDKIQLFLIKNSCGVIVAWTSVLPCPKKQAYIYTYVMRAYRRKKLGTLLISRAVVWCKNKNMSPKIICSKDNSAFFKAVPFEFKVDEAGY